MPLPGQPQFYPDFIVGDKRSKKLGKGILLMETKRDINDQAGNTKIKLKPHIRLRERTDDLLGGTSENGA